MDKRNDKNTVDEKTLKWILVALAGVIVVLFIVIIVVKAVNSGGNVIGENGNGGGSGQGTSDQGGGTGDNGNGEGNETVDDELLLAINEWGAVGEVTEVQKEIAQECLTADGFLAMVTCVNDKYENVTSLGEYLNIYSEMIRTMVEDEAYLAASQSIISRSVYLLAVDRCETALDLFDKTNYDVFTTEALIPIYVSARDAAEFCKDSEGRKKWQELLDQKSEEKGYGD